LHRNGNSLRSISFSQAIFFKSDQTCIWLVPFLFFGLYKIFDHIFLALFHRHFVITNSGQAHGKWKYNDWNNFFSVLLFVLVFIVPLIIHGSIKMKMVLRWWAPVGLVT